MHPWVFTKGKNRGKIQSLGNGDPGVQHRLTECTWDIWMPQSCRAMALTPVSQTWFRHNHCPKGCAGLCLQCLAPPDPPTQHRGPGTQ